MNNKNTIDKKEILKNLVENQLKNIKPECRFSYKDLTRISSKIDCKINETKCCLWNGYVTNLYNPKKGRYVNFYFNKKKQPLHRLVYNNYKGNLEKGEYLKFSCCNKGYCLNINHMDKVYNNIPEKSIKENKRKIKKDTKVSFD